MAYSVEVDEVPGVLGSAVQGAVVSGEGLPGPVEVVGHHVDEVQIPGGDRETVVSKTLPENPGEDFYKTSHLLSNLGDLVSGVDGSFPSSHGGGQQEPRPAGGLGLSCVGSGELLQHSRKQRITM